MSKHFIEADQIFDGWNLEFSCRNCHFFDSGDEDEPVTYLDIETGLCPDCFSEIKEEIWGDHCDCASGCNNCLT